MSEYSTYYETGSLNEGTKEFHIRRFATAKAARAHAQALSMEPQHVGVMHKGLEVASYYGGEAKSSARPNRPRHPVGFPLPPGTYKG
jgi:hypothetical protein